MREDERGRERTREREEREGEAPRFALGGEGGARGRGPSVRPREADLDQSARNVQGRFFEPLPPFSLSPPRRPPRPPPPSPSLLALFLSPSLPLLAPLRERGLTPSHVHVL